MSECFILIGLAALAGYWVGRLITKEPSLDEMLHRLVHDRTNRQLRKLNRKDIEAEIATKSDAQIEQARS